MKKGKNLIDSFEVADNWRQYVEEIYSLCNALINIREEEDVEENKLALP